MQLFKRFIVIRGTNGLVSNVNLNNNEKYFKDKYNFMPYFPG